MNITIEQLNELIPRVKAKTLWIDIINELLPKYEINTFDRITQFLAQVIHESNGFTRLEENLNYKAQRLCEVWSTRFSKVTAERACGKPEIIANIAYSNRMGNGDPSSGDGFKYRGRGLIQLTGKRNYVNMSEMMGNTVDDLVNSLSTPRMALESACAFWKHNGCNELADKRKLTAITKIINGGDIGLTERKICLNNVIEILTGEKQNGNKE
jgi:putative chitinase